MVRYAYLGRGAVLLDELSRSDRYLVYVPQASCKVCCKMAGLVPFHPLGAEASDDVGLPCSKGGLAGWPARYAFTCLEMACKQAIFRSRL